MDVRPSEFVMPYDPLGDMGTRLPTPTAKALFASRNRRLRAKPDTSLQLPVARMIAHGRNLAPARGLAGEFMPGMGDMDDNGMIPGMGDDMLPGMGDMDDNGMIPGMGDAEFMPGMGDADFLPGMGDDPTVARSKRTPRKNHVPVATALSRTRSVSLANGIGKRLSGRPNSRLPQHGGPMLPGLSSDDSLAGGAVTALADEEFLYSQMDGMGDVNLPVVGTVSTVVAVGLAVGAALVLFKALRKRR